MRAKFWCHIRDLAPDTVMRPCFRDLVPLPFFQKSSVISVSRPAWWPNRPPGVRPPSPTPPSPNCAVVPLSPRHTSPFPHATPMTRSMSTLQIRRTVGNDGSRPQLYPSLQGDVEFIGADLSVLYELTNCMARSPVSRPKQLKRLSPIPAGWAVPPRKSAQQARTIPRRATPPLGCQRGWLSSWEISQSNGLTSLRRHCPHRWSAAMRMEPPCTSLQCLHGIPSTCLLFYSSAQATIQSPASSGDLNEQRDSPVQLFPPVLRAANAGLVGRASTRQGLPPLTSNAFFHLRSHLPHRLFLGNGTSDGQ
jgi:hypothetical protein